MGQNKEVQLNYDTNDRGVTLKINGQAIPLKSSGTTRLFSSEHSDKGELPSFADEYFSLQETNSVDLEYKEGSGFFKDISFTFFEFGQKYPSLIVHVDEKDAGKLSTSFQLGTTNPTISTNKGNVSALLAKVPFYSAISIKIGDKEGGISPTNGFLLLNTFPKGEQTIEVSASLDQTIADVKKMGDELVELVLVTPTGTQEIQLNVGAGETKQKTFQATL